jgi:diaminopimelate epimerase
MRGLHFVKMHGCGNDYILIDCLKKRVANPSRLARDMSQPHLGVGADGLILLLPSTRADLRMRIFNPDGSEAETCGNGLRCLGKYIYDRRLTKANTISVQTEAGIAQVSITKGGKKAYELEVNMGRPRPIPQRFFKRSNGSEILLKDHLRVCERDFEIHVVSLGNPHCVIFVNQVQGFEVQRYGPLIESHPLFPSRTNVEFVELVNPGYIKQRTWERGCGETLACGSGACAALVAGVHAGRSKREIQVELRGGRLHLRYAPDGFIYVKGPAEEVFDGIWYRPVIRAHR